MIASMYVIQLLTTILLAAAGYLYYCNEATGDSTYDKPRGTETVDAQFRGDGAVMTGIELSRLRSHSSAGGAGKGRKRAGWCRRNWVMVLLFGVGLFGILFALLCFLKPCVPGVILTNKTVPWSEEFTETVVTNVTRDVTVDVTTTVVLNTTNSTSQTTTCTQTTVQPADVFFMLDGSGSMTPAMWDEPSRCAQRPRRPWRVSSSLA